LTCESGDLAWADEDGVVLAAGSVALLGCLLAERLILPGNGLNAAHGYRPPSPAAL